jgi:hypothetical protein
MTMKQQETSEGYWMPDGKTFAGSEASLEDFEETKYDEESTYYGKGGIEVIEVIKAKLTPEQYRGFLLGNIIKYGLRANFKDQFNRDIQKINYYSDWLKKETSKNQEGQ